MRFSVAAAAFLACVVSVFAQESTVYVTDEITITSCAPTVTNCPAASTMYVHSESSRVEVGGHRGVEGHLRTPHSSLADG
jgi:hypothetical protein